MTERSNPRYLIDPTECLNRNTRITRRSTMKRTIMRILNPSMTPVLGCYAANLQLTNRDERGIGKKIATLHTRAHQFIMSNPPRADPKVDPLGPATSHGNEPSKGAKIDAELKREDEELLRRKGKA